MNEDIKQQLIKEIELANSKLMKDRNEFESSIRNIDRAIIKHKLYIAALNGEELNLNETNTQPD